MVLALSGCGSSEATDNVSNVSSGEKKKAKRNLRRSLMKIIWFHQRMYICGLRLLEQELLIK